ncbi:DUF975 family protein [Hydrogenoanaerobacterium sp.]|uniref:DUF975 family protein n=1 Tax=Hydrogenoanaerobacterium sp. TaxID=2953763 RepID=UPI00289E2509|nr:DUF975 family protein [Hydrogenoanaerobacterium sp.]
MWERAELKTNAKAALSRYYWMAFAVCLVYGVISGMGSGGSSVINVVNNLQNTGTIRLSNAALMGLASVAIGLGAVGIALSFLVINPLMVGLYRYFMESRTFKSDFGTLFYGFTGGRYWKNVGVMALVNVKTFLWGLLLIIPGIIKSYEYYMIPYILAENDEIETSRIFELSKQMTDHEKMNIFVLNLSFLGWVLLGALLCGIGTLFVNPYIYATDAELYALMRAKAFAMNFSNAGELPDFHPPVYGQLG